MLPRSTIAFTLPLNALIKPVPDNITVHAEPEDVIVSISGVLVFAEVEEEETAVDEAEPEVVEKGKKTEEE